MTPIDTGAGRKPAGLISADYVRALVFGLVIFSACVIGIITRPLDFTALLWPANALMLGMLIRYPRFNRPSAWIFASAAFMAADLLTGSSLEKAMLLNLGNLAGVAAGLVAFRYLPAKALRMHEPASVLHLVIMSAVAAAVAGMVGAITGPVMFGIAAFDAWVFWFTSELVNYVALLPIILSAPAIGELKRTLRLARSRLHIRYLLPALSLLACCAFALFSGGPGAIALTVPALIWCALAYPVFVVSVLTLAVNYGSQTVLSAVYITDVIDAVDERALTSIRLAAFMVALAPIALSIVVRSREDLVRQLSAACNRVDLAMDAGGIVATWEINFSTRDIVFEGSFAGLFQLQTRAQGGIAIDEVVELIHPDDRERATVALRAAIASDTEYSCRYRMILPSGEVRWFAAFGTLQRDSSLSASKLVGILIDVTDEAEAVEALEQSNRRFNIVSESIPQIVWSTDAKGRHDYFNRRWSDFTGIAPEDILPHTWEGLVHPQDWARVDETWRQCLATGKTYDLDYRFRSKGGQYRWLKVLANPLRNSEGVVTRWYGTSTDIDEAKQLDAEREIISRELDHRIGNLFALVNGLVGLTSRDAPDVKTAMRDLRGRLSALHNAHTLIRRDRTEDSVTLMALLHQIIAPYVAENDNVDVRGDDIKVSSSAATAAALLFHELATNAVKYGALRESVGHLQIDLSHKGDRFFVSWTETGKPQLDGAPCKGFGSKLLATIVEGQLGGQLTRTISEEGLTISIDLPAQSLMAHRM